MAVVDTAQISTATKKKKTTKKKATPVYWATLSDGSRAQCTIVGTNGGNKIQGTPGNDVICGLGGNDKIYGNGGNDVIDAGNGNDLVVGGAGNDFIEGGSGSDKLLGSEGNDLISGSAGNDTQMGESGHDEILGGVGNDKILGGEQDDLTSGEAGTDVLSGEGGHDELSGGAGKDKILGGAGSNTCSTDKQDKQVSQCYFDNSNPDLVDMYMEPSSIDTSVGPQTVYLYVRLSDETGGFPIFNLWGAQFWAGLSRIEVREDGTEQMEWVSGVNLNATYESCDTLDMTKSMNPQLIFSQNGCRIDGGRLDPLIRFTITLPQYSKPGRYVVNSINFKDAVQNSNGYTFKNEKCGNNCNFSGPGITPKYWSDRISTERASFVQVGSGDTSAPTVSSISHDTSVDVSGGSKLLNVIVYAQDNVGFSETLFGQSVIQMNFNQGGAMAASPSANLGGNATGVNCASLSSWQQANTGCLISPGVFKAVVRVPSNALNGFYFLNSLSVTDRVGNSASYSPNCQGCPNMLNFTKPDGFWVSGSTTPTDTSPPRLTGVEVSPNWVSTYEYAQTVFAYVNIEEVGGFTGFGNVSLEFGTRDSSGAIATRYSGQVNQKFNVNGDPIGFQTCADHDAQKSQTLSTPGNYWIEMGCLNSQSGNAYQFRIPINLPAHAKSGNYSLINLSVSDGQNSVMYPDVLMPGSPGSTISSVLGFSPGFTNG